MQLCNPIPMDVSIDSILLHTEGAAFQPQAHTALKLPPSSEVCVVVHCRACVCSCRYFASPDFSFCCPQTYTVRLFGVPLSVGTLDIKGCRVRAFNMEFFVPCDASAMVEVLPPLPLLSIRVAGSLEGRSPRLRSVG